MLAVDAACGFEWLLPIAPQRNARGPRRMVSRALELHRAFQALFGRFWSMPPPVGNGCKHLVALESGGQSGAMSMVDQEGLRCIH
jgi:hypothetical protein